VSKVLKSVPLSAKISYSPDSVSLYYAKTFENTQIKQELGSGHKKFDSLEKNPREFLPEIDPVKIWTNHQPHIFPA